MLRPLPRACVPLPSATRLSLAQPEASLVMVLEVFFQSTINYGFPFLIPETDPGFLVKTDWNYCTFYNSETPKAPSTLCPTLLWPSQYRANAHTPMGC